MDVNSLAHAEGALPMYYLVSFSRGAGALPLPECEDTCPPDRMPCLGGR